MATATAEIEVVKFEEDQRTYIAGEDFDHLWDPRAVRMVEKLWNEGKDIGYLSKAFERDTEDVFILLLDRAKKGKLNHKPRLIVL